MARPDPLTVAARAPQSGSSRLLGALAGLWSEEDRGEEEGLVFPVRDRAVHRPPELSRLDVPDDDRVAVVLSEPGPLVQLQLCGEAGESGVDGDASVLAVQDGRKAVDVGDSTSPAVARLVACPVAQSAWTFTALGPLSPDSAS